MFTEATCPDGAVMSFSGCQPHPQSSAACTRWRWRWSSRSYQYQHCWGSKWAEGDRDENGLSVFWFESVLLIKLMPDSPHWGNPKIGRRQEVGSTLHRAEMREDLSDDLLLNSYSSFNQQKRFFCTCSEQWSGQQRMGLPLWPFPLPAPVPEEEEPCLESSDQATRCTSTVADYAPLPHTITYKHIRHKCKTQAIRRKV